MLSLQADWKIPVNSQYQDGMKLLMNLVTAALVLPIVFVRNFVNLGPQETLSRHLRPQAYWAWGFLTGSLWFGMLFYWASAKYVKVVSGGPESMSEQTFETVRDVSMGVAFGCFLAGVVCLLWFLATCQRETRSD